MKIRNGFVSNSSSSSFICDISGYDVSGWDMGLSDAGMYNCENGHTFSEGYIEEVEKEAIEFMVRKIMVKYPENFDGTFEDLDEDDLEDIAYDWDLRYEFPQEFCPLCSFEHIRDKDLADFLLKNSALTREEVLAELKEKFSSFKEFKQFIKG